MEAGFSVPGRDKESGRPLTNPPIGLVRTSWRLPLQLAVPDSRIHDPIDLLMKLEAALTIESPVKISDAGRHLRQIEQDTVKPWRGIKNGPEHLTLTASYVDQSLEARDALGHGGLEGSSGRFTPITRFLISLLYSMSCGSFLLRTFTLI
jgi:hypothetical protein